MLSVPSVAGVLIVVGLVFAAVAAAVHVYIFLLESFWWTLKRGRAVFGTTEAQAEATKQLAYNQGFYNLFLAIMVALGIVLFAYGQAALGATLVFAGAGSMVAAGVVLLLSDRRKARAALTQLVPPLIGVVALAIGLLLA